MEQAREKKEKERQRKERDVTSTNPTRAVAPLL
jgi:hypothetical protein